MTLKMKNMLIKLRTLLIKLRFDDSDKPRHYLLKHEGNIRKTFLVKQSLPAENL